MSDSEDILGEDLGDHSLADYNIGNEEEEQLLADDYERGESQNVPASVGPHYEVNPPEYSNYRIDYNTQIPPPYQPSEPECVVPNITVEVPNIPPVREPLPTYAPYPDRHYENEHAVPPPIVPGPVVLESPQIVPSELGHPVADGPRDRFISERPPGAQRLPQVRDIPDTLDKVMLPRGAFLPRGRTNTWRNPQLRRGHPYRHNNPRGNFVPRPSFPPPQVRPPPSQARPEIRPDIVQPMPPPSMPPTLSEPPERPMMPADMQFRPENRQFQPNFGPRFPNPRPRMEEPRPNFVRPHFEQRPMFPQQQVFNRPPFGPPIREIAPNMSHIPQVTIRQPGPGNPNGPMPMPKGPEVRMLPVQLPPNLPPGGLGKKVLINPHFKGNFQPPDGLPLPAYIPTRIQKSPPISPTLENKFGPIKDIDDAAERFIAEQRNALARAANRKPPQRYIENTTIEIENELARKNEEDQDLLRRQQEFIQSNRDGLRRRMRSPPATARRSPERRRVRTRSRSPPPPRASPPPHAPHSPHSPHDEESEYRRRLREQESLRERVLRAKEVRRRKNAVALHKQLQDREREKQDQNRDEREKPAERPRSPPLRQEEKRPEPKNTQQARSPEIVKPDTTRKSPEKVVEKNIVRERSPVKKDSEVNSTCEGLTPPRPASRGHTPPLPRRALDSDDELELILDDIDGILSDDDDSGRFKERTNRSEPPKSKPSVDLRSKLATKQGQEKPRNKIVFNEDKASRRDKSPAKTKSPPRRTVVSSSTKNDQSEKKTEKVKTKNEIAKSRQRITYENEKELGREKQEDSKSKSQFSNRRVILQRKVNNSPDKKDRSSTQSKADLSKPNPGIFSRAMRTAIGSENRIIIKKIDDTQIEYDSSSDTEDVKSPVSNVASVTNLPHGMTDTRLKTLAGNDVQNLILNREDRSAKIVFKSPNAAEHFKKKFNNKMVAASRLTVTLR